MQTQALHGSLLRLRLLSEGRLQSGNGVNHAANGAHPHVNHTWGENMGRRHVQSRPPDFATSHPLTRGRRGGASGSKGFERRARIERSRGRARASLALAKVGRRRSDPEKPRWDLSLITRARWGGRGSSSMPFGLRRKADRGARVTKATRLGTGSSHVAPGSPKKLREDADPGRWKASLVAASIWASRARVATRSNRAERLAAETSEARWSR